MLPVISLITNWAEIRGIDKLVPSKEGFVVNILEELCEGLGYEFPRSHAKLIAAQNLQPEGLVSEHDYIDSLADVVVFSLTEMLKYGYKPERVLCETYNEISSRTGSYSEGEAKWVKDKSPEAKAKWYTARYEKCKLD